jgi:TIR domain
MIPSEGGEEKVGQLIPDPSPRTSTNVSDGVDFFISYTPADLSWAEWIAWELEAAGFTTVVQAWDFGPGTNFALEMDRAARTAERTIAVLSPAYLDALYTQSEWAAAFTRDPTGERRALVPVRVQACRLTGLLAQVVHLDLAGKDEEAARQALLNGIRLDRLKPAVRPPFPSGRRRAGSPAFPGATPAVLRVPPGLWRNGRRVWIGAMGAVAVAVAVTVAVVRPGSPVHAPLGAPAITLSRATAPRGTQIKVYGRGFQPDEQVTLELAGKPVGKPATPGTSGNFTKSINVPSWAPPPGVPTTVSAEGDSTRRPVSAPFTTAP